MQIKLILSLSFSVIFSCSEVSVDNEDGKGRQALDLDRNGKPTAASEDFVVAVQGTSNALNSKNAFCTDGGQDPGQYDHPGQIEGSCEEEPVTPIFEILRINTRGLGCAQESVSANVSSDAEAFTLVFADFFIELPQLDSTSDLDSKQCTIELEIGVRHGYRFKVSQIDFRGYISLDPQVTGSLSSRYRFLERPDANFYISNSFSGPRDESFLIQDLGQDEAAFWSPCSNSGRVTLQIDTTMMLVDKSGGGDQLAYLSLDSADGDFGQDLHLNWDHCR